MFLHLPDSILEKFQGDLPDYLADKIQRNKLEMAVNEAYDFVVNVIRENLLPLYLERFGVYALGGILDRVCQEEKMEAIIERNNSSPIWKGVKGVFRAVGSFVNND